MERYTSELRFLCHTNQVPLIIAGDIFHNWNSPPELVNFVIRQFRKFHPHRIYSVPGQHDIPLHVYKDIQKSSYYTLMEAGVITDLIPGKPRVIPVKDTQVRLHGFPWGFSPTPNIYSRKAELVELAVIHKFIWNEDTGYPNAPEGGRVENIMSKLKGYDIIIAGDNHRTLVYT